jgi:hypothetical protein
MSETTANLELPYILPSQAQKHVTHNEALQRLDAVTQLTVTASLATPPSDPEEGTCYHIVDRRMDRQERQTRLPPGRRLDLHQPERGLARLVPGRGQIEDPQRHRLGHL